MYKDQPSIFVLTELKKVQYSAPVKSILGKDILFCGPAEYSFAEVEALEIDKVHREFKIPVPISDTETIWIIPASLEPKNIILSLDAATVNDAPYGQTTEYGRVAYELFNENQDGKEIQLTDPRVIKLVSLALQRSYNMPLDLWNQTQFIGMHNYPKLVFAAFGTSEDLLKKKDSGLTEQSSPTV
jgi:hypothetical protein